MNLSHIIHEFSFGPYFPAIAQPLDMTYKLADAPFMIYQYFLSVVPTTYIDSSGRRVKTSQYAVTDYDRVTQHGKGVPGIFFKFDIEALNMTIEQRTISLYHFLIRLAGVIGGVWTTASFGLRVFARAEREVKTKIQGKKGSSDEDGIIPTSVAGTPMGGRSTIDGGGGDYLGRPGHLRKSSGWLSGAGNGSGLLVH